MTLDRPLLRWIGGKQQLLGDLLRHLPANIEELDYCEPFLGAGSLFFALAPSSARVSDLNGHLIDCYRCVRDNPDLIARYLGTHKSKDSSEYYYCQRDLYNTGSLSAAQAARFIYLNKTCFNGVFRVNLQGKFNVPYGHKKTPAIPSLRELRDASAILMKADVRHETYEVAISAVGKGVFVYLDPPYPPLNGTSYFTHYTPDRFGVDDQRKLAGTVSALHERGGLFLMTNADTPLIRDLYRDFNIVRLPVTRFVTCKKKRHQVFELVITNYVPVQGSELEGTDA